MLALKLLELAEVGLASEIRARADQETCHRLNTTSIPQPRCDPAHDPWCSSCQFKVHRTVCALAKKEHRTLPMELIGRSISRPHS